MASAMKLTKDQIDAIADGRGSLLTTCDGDIGYGPCGEWSQYTYSSDGAHVYCAAGHEIEEEIEEDIGG
jgi:hypothetical protein